MAKYGSMNSETKYALAAEDLPGVAPVELSKTQAEKELKRQAKAIVRVEHLDIIKNEFWEQRPWLLSSKADRPNLESL